MEQLFSFSNSHKLRLFLWTLAISCSCLTNVNEEAILDFEPVPSGSIHISGELAKRIQQSEYLLLEWNLQKDVVNPMINDMAIKFPETGKEKFWKQYLAYGMTENHENYDSFHSYNGKSDPEVVIQSFLYATQLWRETKQNKFRDEAELIYYNGICNLQYSDGNWGSNNTPGNKIQDVCLKPVLLRQTFEKTSRCTNGLKQIADLSYFISGETLYLPFYRESQLNLSDKNKILNLSQQTDYPFGNQVDIIINENSYGINQLKIAIPQWTERHQLFINGEKIVIPLKQGYLNIKRKFKNGDHIKLTFAQCLRFSTPINKKNINLDQIKIYYGPLLMGYNGIGVKKLTTFEEFISLDNYTFIIKNRGIKITPIYKSLRNNTPDINRKIQILF